MTYANLILYARDIGLLHLKWEIVSKLWVMAMLLTIEMIK